MKITFLFTLLFVLFTGISYSENEVVKELGITAHNFTALSTWPQSAKRTKSLDTEVSDTNGYLMSKKVIVRPLTKSEMTKMLKDINLLVAGGKSTWGKNEIKFCLDEKILVGREKGTNSSSLDWKKALTREEFAAGLARMERRIDNHDNNKSAHHFLQVKINRLTFMFWIMAAIVAFFVGFFLLWRR